MTQAQPPAAPPAAGTKPPGQGLAIAGMVLGIVALALFCIWYVSVPCAIVGLILSILAKNKARAAGAKFGMAKAGIILSVIALGLAVVMIILAIVGFSLFGHKIQEEIQRQQQMQQNAMLYVRGLLGTLV